MPINYNETDEFKKDFKRLSKKYRTLAEDFALVKKAAVELFHIQNIDNQSVFCIPNYSSDLVKVYKIKKFACKALKGKGVKSGIRIIYTFNFEQLKVTFIEIYFKSEQENEKQERIKAYLKKT